tara:strand:+ start:1420 stop:2049 length:630 start_codon:yes stop_codon:yes gene_type:complete
MNQTILIFLLFCIVNASILQTIKNSVHSHAYLRDVDAICEVVTHRLAINGVYIRHKKDCTHANITSSMATTLHELYQKFENTDMNKLKTQYYLLKKKHIECQRKCVIEMLFDGPIEYWVNDHIPVVNFDDCWPTCDFNITIGSLEINQLAYEPCLDCLASADITVQQYNNFRVKFIQYEATLSKEIAMVWRFQMPGILEKKAGNAMIKY